MGNSYEGWVGLHVRYSWLVLFNSVRIAPGLTFGLSAITKPVGIEAAREADAQGDARLLGYLGPDLAISFMGVPNLELVYRLQHRSGASGNLGRMHDAANAQCFWDAFAGARERAADRPRPRGGVIERAAGGLSPLLDETEDATGCDVAG
jgi:hypothetical protein